MPAFAKMQRQRPVRLQVILPDGAEPFGQTPEGIPLYRMTKTKVTTKPDYEPIKSDECGFDHKWLDDTVRDPVCRECGITGHQKHRKSTTGEELIGLRKHTVNTEEFIFMWEDEGNGNNKLVEYNPPTDEQLAEAARKERRAFLQDKLLDALADGKINLEDMIAGKTARKKETPAPTKEAEEAVEEYPFMYAPGRWRLSNGTEMRGKKVDAIEAERQIVETRESLAGVPEY